LEQYAHDNTLGTYHTDDFTQPRTTAYTTTALAVNDGWIVGEAGATGSASGTFSNTADADGVVRLSGVTGTDWEGSQAQAGEATAQGESVVLPTHATDGRGTVVFEWYGLFDEETADTFFIGLAEPDMAATALLGATGGLTDAADYIGFYRLDSGDLQFVVRNDNAGGTAVEYEVDIVTDANLADVDNEQVKLSFRVNADNSVEVYYNEVRILKTSDTGADIDVPSTALPIEYLTRKLVVLRGAAGDNDPVQLDTDYIDCYVAE
jgi:hypothetical protein